MDKDDQTMQGFENLRQDLEVAFKNDPILKKYIVGDTHTQDFGNEDGLFKFKIYANTSKSNPPYGFSYDPTVIDDLSE
jgi:hypothetical protein